MQANLVSDLGYILLVALLDDVCLEINKITCAMLILLDFQGLVTLGISPNDH